MIDMDKLDDIVMATPKVVEFKDGTRIHLGDTVQLAAAAGGGEGVVESIAMALTPAGIEIFIRCEDDDGHGSVFVFKTRQ